MGFLSNENINYPPNILFLDSIHIKLHLWKNNNEEVNAWEYFCPTELPYSITLWTRVCNSIRQKFLLGGSSNLHSIHPDLKVLINAFHFQCNILREESNTLL